MSAQYLHISIDFKGDVNADALEEKFNLALDWIHYLPNCWIVRTSSSAERWLSRLAPLLDEKDLLLIIKVDLSEKAARLPDWVLNWIKQYPNSRTRTSGPPVGSKSV